VCTPLTDRLDVCISYSKDFESDGVSQTLPIHASSARARVDRGASSCAAFPRREALPSDEKHGEGA